MSKLFVSLITFFMAGIAAIVYFDVKDSREWKAYATANHCSMTGSEKSETRIQLFSTGKGFIHVPQTITKKEWLCDGDERVWR